MTAATGTRPDLARAREVIALSCRIHGRKRGWHAAAELLGVPERRIESILYGEPARVDPIRVEQARLSLSRTRAAQLRAELAQLEEALHGAPVDLALPPMGASR